MNTKPTGREEAGIVGIGTDAAYAAISTSLAKRANSSTDYCN